MSDAPFLFETKDRFVHVLRNLTAPLSKQKHTKIKKNTLPPSQSRVRLERQGTTGQQLQRESMKI